MPAHFREFRSIASRSRRSAGIDYESRPFHSAGSQARVPGADPQARSYFTWAPFSDPAGNGWLLQELKTRLPGREWA